MCVNLVSCRRASLGRGVCLWRPGCGGVPVRGVGIGEQQGGNLSPSKTGSDPALPQEQRKLGQATDSLMQP